MQGDVSKNSHVDWNEIIGTDIVWEYFDWRSYYWHSRQRAYRYTLIPLSPEIIKRFPIEIVEGIFRFLEQRDLHTTMLVCKEWRYHSLHLLYTSIHVSSRETMDRLARLPGAMKNHLDRTRSLRIGEDDGDEPFAYSALLLLGGLMRNLRQLSIHDCTSLTTRGVRSFKSFTAFRGVASLHLANLQLSRIIELREFLSAFPCLTFLSISEIKLTSRPPKNGADAEAESRSSRVVQRPVEMRLQTLQLHVVGMEEETCHEIIDWLTRSLACEKLLHLVVGKSPNPQETATADMLLRAVGPSLLDLEERYIPEDEPASHIHLENCTKLRSLCFEVVEFEWRAIASEVQAIFSSITCKSLETIRMQLNADAGAHNEPTVDGIYLPDLRKPPRAKDLRLLHAVLSRPLFNNLKTVDIHIDTDYDAGHGESMADLSGKATADALVEGTLIRGLRTLLAPWYARGILRFSKTFEGYTE